MSACVIVGAQIGFILLISQAWAETADNDHVTVNFPNSPVAAIIPFYSQLTGKKMILDAGLQGEMLRIIGTRPLTKREAVAFIESSLLLNGYAVLPIDQETVKLIHHSGGKNPRSEGLPVITSARELPEGEQIVNYVMPLLHISPDEATKAFQQVVQLHAYGSITPITNASAIIITENTSTIRSLVNLAEVIDVSPAEIANEMIKLERSDADSIAEIIKQIYEEKEKSASSVVSAQPAAQPVQAGRPNLAPLPQPAVQNNVANVNPTAARVKIIPYRRTNQILVIARPVDIAYIKGLVQKLDQKGDGLNFKKRSLHFISVSDFLPVAYNALARDTDIQSEGGGEATGGSKRPRSSSNSPSTDNANRNAEKSSRNSSQGSGTEHNHGSNSSLTDPDQTESPNSMVVGKTLLIADPQSNSLIVSGSTEHVNIIDQLLNEMDVRPQQIYINTLIGHLNIGDQYKVGFDMVRLLDDFTLRQINPLTRANGIQAVAGSTTNAGTLVNAQPGVGGTTNVISGTGTGTTTGTTTGTGDTIFNNQVGDPAGIIQVPFNPGNFNFNSLNLYGQIGSLSRYVNLLEQNKKFKVLSRPSVYT
ncbi:MAG: secretin N-terminal domain-containing protein, partial [Verrucomicrobiota bacterium]